MFLSSEQRAAVYAAKKLLDDAGLTTPPLPTSDHVGDAGGDLADVTRVISQTLLIPPSAPFQYIPPHSRPFTAEELLRGRDCINRQTYVHAIVEHPAGAIVEYPETGTVTGVAIAHVFSVDPASFTHPKENFQYSLGDSRWGECNVFCGGLLPGQDGHPVYCSHKRTCKAPGALTRVTVERDPWREWKMPYIVERPLIDGPTRRELLGDEYSCSLGSSLLNLSNTHRGWSELRVDL
ncbi:hypothetical protein R3P38DRAFT_3503189 [Favolaschia claudopus]|uniref:Uncharacterized protein n=1 Tax=Favolaschia claudopus TaxID=2862362 RepID=A0AAW0C1A3_9AGAR